MELLKVELGPRRRRRRATRLSQVNYAGRSGQDGAAGRRVQIDPAESGLNYYATFGERADASVSPMHGTRTYLVCSR